MCVYVQYISLRLTVVTYIPNRGWVLKSFNYLQLIEMVSRTIIMSRLDYQRLTMVIVFHYVKPLGPAICGPFLRLRWA